MHKTHQQYTCIHNMYNNLQLYKAHAMHAMPFLKWKMHTVPLYRRIEDRTAATVTLKAAGFPLSNPWTRLDFILRRRRTNGHIPSLYPHTLPAWHARRCSFPDLLTLALTGRHNTSVNSNSIEVLTPRGYVPGICAIYKLLRTMWIHIMRSANYRLRRLIDCA